MVLWDIKHTPDYYGTHCDISDACAEYLYEHVYDAYGTVDAVLAAQPCTDFAVSGARWFAAKDASGQTQASIDLVYATLAIIDHVQPTSFWSLENPISRIHNLVPEVGKPRMYFNPCDFGEPYTKRTALYGDFNTALVKTPVEPTEGSMMWKKYGGKSERTKAARSVTPPGFAEAFFAANDQHEIEYEELLW